jgi:alkylhydroperoxidase family enzyme
MPRLPYKTDSEAERSTPPHLLAAILERRGGALMTLDRALLYSPALAEGWNELLGRVRSQLSLRAELRELAICAVAAINKAEYELHHHGPLFLKAGGTAAQLQALHALPAPPAPDLFDSTSKAALDLTVEMTRNVQVGDATFAAARQALADDRALVELIGVVAAYNMVSRFLEALQIVAEI